MKRSSQRVVALLAAASFALAACGSDTDTADAPAEELAAEEPVAEDDGGIDYASVSGTLIRAGASSHKAGMLGWQVGFQSVAPNATVEYDPIGSGGGRKQFLGGGSDFAGSDAALKDEEWEASKEVCAGDLGAINLPHYISPIAIPYNLPSIVGETLNLSAEVIAGIFANTITNWTDPANPSKIVTVRGLGYKFERPAT